MKKWSLVVWEKLRLPKHNGGLGLRDLLTLSRALGEKLLWRWVLGEK